MARGYRTELRMMSYHVRRLEAQLAALGKENDLWGARRNFGTYDVILSYMLRHG